MNKHDLIQIIKNDFWIFKTNRISVQKLQSKGNEEIEAYLINFSLLLSPKVLNLAERFYIIENNIKEIPRCICGNSLKFKNYQKGYLQFCSKLCMYEARKLPFFEKIKRLDLSKIILISNREIVKLILNVFVENNKLINGSTRDLGLLPKNMSLIKYLKETFDYMPNNVSISELLYLTINNTFIIPKCNCGKELSFRSFEEGYPQYCSSRCVSLYTREKVKMTNLRNLGVEYPTQNKSVLQKQQATNLRKRGVINVSQDPVVQQTRQETFMKKYGISNSMKVPEIARKCNESNTNNGGHSLSKPENHQKSKEAINKKYGKPYYSQTEDYKLRYQEIEQTRIDTVRTRYQVDYVTQTNSHKQNVIDSKRENGTFHTSNPEINLFNFLQLHYPSIVKHEQIPTSKLNCDYYIPEIDLWIELQGFWTHNFKAFNESNKEHIAELKQMQINIEQKGKEEKAIKFYQNQIKVWTIRDPIKRRLMKALKLNYLEIFDYGDFDNVLIQIDRVVRGLQLVYSIDFLKKDYLKIQKNQGRYDAMPSNNYITDYFQQDIFFEKENKLYTTDPIIRRQLIENRKKYKLREERELTNKLLLSGFKISRLHYGYSYFSPLWIKKFIEVYNIKSIYDPCGGWGHRLLGASNLDLYIYNDIDLTLCNNIQNMVDILEIQNTVIFNKDASTLILKEQYDAVFTCPPYYDVELYSQGSSESNYNYDDWLNIWWRNLIISSTKNHQVNYFSYVIDRNHLEDMNKILINENYQILEEIELGFPLKNFSNNSQKKNKDILVISIHST